MTSRLTEGHPTTLPPATTWLSGERCSITAAAIERDHTRSALALLQNRAPGSREAWPPWRPGLLTCYFSGVGEGT
jgi:hypothetical protein